MLTTTTPWFPHHFCYPFNFSTKVQIHDDVNVDDNNNINNDIIIIIWSVCPVYPFAIADGVANNCIMPLFFQCQQQCFHQSDDSDDTITEDTDIHMIGLFSIQSFIITDDLDYRLQ